MKLNRKNKSSMFVIECVQASGCGLEEHFEVNTHNANVKMVDDKKKLIFYA